MDAEIDGLKNFEKRAIKANNFLHCYILKFGETSEWSEDYKRSIAKIFVAGCRRLVRDLSEEINDEYLKVPWALEAKESLQIELNLLEKVALPYVN